MSEDLDAAFEHWYASGGREELAAAGIPSDGSAHADRSERLREWLDQQRDGKPAGRTDAPALALPSERHRELLTLLRANSHRDRSGRLVSQWSQQQLAAKLHVSVRTLQNLIADLREPGSDPRHPTTKGAGLRLGLVKVEPTRRDPPIGGRVFAANLYVIVEPLRVGPTSENGLRVGPTSDDAQTRRSHRHATSEQAATPGEPEDDGKPAAQTDTQTQTRRSHRSATKKAPLTSENDAAVACLEQEPKPPSIPPSTDGVEPVAGTTLELAAAPALERAQLDPPAVLLRDRQPTASEIRATLERAFGTVRMLGTVANDDPDAAAKLDQLAGCTSLPSGWSWRKQWSADPIGRCVRCNRKAHTPGLDGRPWHAFCWGHPDLPLPPTQRRTKRRRIAS